MRIGFIGAGKVGTALGIYFHERGYPISGYLSHSRDHAALSARAAGASVFNDYMDIASHSDILFLTVPDASIREVAGELAASADDLTSKWIIHTSGAYSSSVFPDLCGACGFSLHPAMAISDPYKAAGDFSSTIFTIEGAPDGAALFFREAGLNVLPIASKDKAIYHLACAVSSNFVVALFSWATDLLSQAGFGAEDARRILTPIFISNARSVAEKGPVAALTGPVERADKDTVGKHLSCLSDPSDRQLYRLLSEKLIRLAEEKNPSRRYDDLEESLWH
ncbi:MAG: DUF2520 domain-containing protein [Lachnospiraceae bacterium]|nr:DUF2520 domain-containing protein [Lachnospiraceae bacterium]